MFDAIPVSVANILENNDLSAYSVGVRVSKHGPVLQIGAMFPYERYKWEPLDAEENKELRKDVKAQLLAAGYKSKVRSFVHPDIGVDVNDFRIRVLLRVGIDIDSEIVDKLKEIRRRLRRAKKRLAKRRRLSTQL